MSQSYSPCAACKYLRRKCTNECVFGAYFPQEEPKKFSDVHKVFGASNVAKILNDLPEAQREGAVESLAYEADARLRDPVYGSMRLISILKHRLKQYQMDLYNAQKELSAYIGPSALLPVQPPGSYVPQYQHNSSSSAILPYNMQQAQVMGGLPPNVASPPMVIQQLQYQKMMDAHQAATAAAAAIREQELLNTCEQQQQAAAQHVGQQQSEQLVMYDTGYQIPAAGGFNQIGVSEASGPALALRSFGGPCQIQQHTQEHPHLHHLHNQIQVQQLLLEQQEQQQILLFAQPLQLESQQQQQILSFAQPLQVDPQQQLHHSDGSEGEGGSIGGLALGPFDGPYQIRQHTQEHPYLHPHYHHQLEVQQLLPEQQRQQQQSLSLAQPLQVDPKQQLEQHREGSEEEGRGIGGLALSPFDGPYQIRQHTQEHPRLHPHYHHQLEVQQLLTEQQWQQQSLSLAQPLQVDPKQQLEQHREGSEEEGRGNGCPALGPFDGPYQIRQHTQEHPYLHPHYHHQLEVQQPLPEQQQQPQTLVLERPLQMDPQQLQLQLEQHIDGSEEEGGSNSDPL